MKLSIEKIAELEEGTRFTIFDEDGNKFRAVRENGNCVFIYAKGAKRYGRRLTVDSNLLPLYYTEINLETPEEADAKWHKRIKRAVKCLESTGLWPEKLKFLKSLSKLTYSDKKEMGDLYWNVTGLYSHISNKQRKKEDISAEREEIDRFWKDWHEKYPFIFYRDKDDILHIDNQYIWELSEVNLKSMYFGKWHNKRIKQEIAEALESQNRYTVRERVNYDVSFEYDPERKAAWYSEEYKDCGNGHYYIALNNSTALFCEND